MTALVFVDTNVWLYARDTADPRKHAVARDWLARLWGDACGRTSLQVLSEYYVNVTKRLSKPLSADEAWEDVSAMLAWDPQPIDVTVVQCARAIERRYGLGWWDCLIVSAARAQDCATLLTEDLQDGQVLTGVRILNPFASRVSDDAAHAPIAPRRSRPSRMRA